MTQPTDTLEMLIRCIHCRRPLKLNGETQEKHTELLHRLIPGEKAAICQTCYNNAETLYNYVGQGNSWAAGKIVEPI